MFWRRIEIVAAFVVLKSGSVASDQELRRRIKNCGVGSRTAASDQELRQFAAQKIADYKLPEQITFLTEFPRGLTNKLQRRVLRGWAGKANHP